MSNYEENKETAVSIVPKEHFAYLKENSGFEEHIVKHLSSELAERIMGVLDREEEIIVGQSDLRVSELTYNTQYVEYRRQINWSSLVRCKDCKHCGLSRMTGNTYCDLGIGLYNLDDFCSRGERKEDADD